MKSQTPSFVLGLLGAMVYTAAAAAAPPANWAAFDDPARAAKLANAFPQVDRVMREFVARENVPGAAWGIVVDGRLAHLGTTGLRDVEGARPVQGDSVFRIASMTKSFTAMAILKLRDEGKSLLPIGMTAVQGDFSRGDVIAIRDQQGLEIARGLANYASAEARLLCRKPSNEFTMFKNSL